MAKNQVLDPIKKKTNETFTRNYLKNFKESSQKVSVTSVVK